MATTSYKPHTLSEEAKLFLLEVISRLEYFSGRLVMELTAQIPSLIDELVSAKLIKKFKVKYKRKFIPNKIFIRLNMEKFYEPEY